MSALTGTTIAVLAAPGAAGAFGVAAALQHSQAQLASRSGAAIGGIALLGRYTGAVLRQPWAAR